MINKIVRPIPRRPRTCRQVKISLSFLAALFHLENSKPFLGAVETVEDDVREIVPALLNKDYKCYVNLLTGGVLNLSPETISYKADVWYMPRNDTFRFIVEDKCMATINRLELIKVFGCDVITNLKIKLR